MRTIPADLRLYYLQRPSPLPGWQTYFPSLELLFPSLADQTTGSPCLAASELIVSLDTETRTAVVEHLLKKQKRTVPIWTRQMHLLEPLDVMAKEYVMPRDGALPTFREAWQRALVKINDPFNEAYTDAVIACMVSRLVETGKSPHFCRFFGTFNGRTPTYSYNITDDMEDVEHEDWFREGLAAGAFKIMAVDPTDPTVTAELTQPWSIRRRPLAVAEGDESVAVSDCDLDLEEDTSEQSDLSASHNHVSGLEEIDDIAASGEEAVLRRPQNRLRLTKASGSSSEDSSDSSEEDEDEDGLEYKVILQDYPVQMTVLERCDGTMDDLMEDEVADEATADMRETKEARWTAWIFQVVAALTAAQHYYDFIHNDLHTNNVMWCGTGETHLYYHVTGATGGDRYYRVPTYGRLFKIIDFGRATFRPSAASKKDNHVWFPDAYAPDADATGQYNCGPYFEQGKPKVLPNKSFDLCRLAAAMLDTLWPYPEECPEAVQPRRVLTREPGRVQPETVSPLWNLLWLWLTDRYGKNLLRTPGDTERFPGFDLYCAIARDAVNAVPAQQLTLPLFDSAYRCRRRDIPADVPIYKLQAVHRPATA